MKKLSQSLLVLAVIGLIAAGCGKTTSTNENINSTSNETPSNANSAPADANTATTTKTFNVVGTNFSYDPAEIRVNQGDTVVINFTNPDKMPHDWVLDEFSGARTKVLDKDQSESITFVADKKGSFEFYCSVGQHRQMGMKGMFIVE